MALSDLQTQLDTADEVADDATEELKSYLDAAQQAAGSYSNTGVIPDVDAPVVAVPPFSPNTQLSSTFQSDFDTTWADLETWVRGLMTDWMNTYFPTIDPQLGVAEDSWLLDVVQNGYSGIPPALEQAIWDRARAKELLEAVRMEEEANAQFASRGFAMPPGVLANRVLQIQQEAANKSSTIARDAAIKQIEIAIEMTKVAITEITKLRLGIANALADYIRAWMALPAAAAEIAKAKTELDRFLWDSTAAYINAQVNVANLSLDADKFNATKSLDQQKLDITTWADQNKLRVDTALQAAKSMGELASSTRASQNTLVSIADNTNNG